MPKTPDPADELAVLLASINKKHGAGSILQLGDDPLPAVEAVTSGSIALDEALGVGGLPRGRVVELFGPESSGKTSIALRAVAQHQKAGLVAAFIDAEHALDPDWADTLGVDTDALLVSQPDTGEQALEIADMLAKSGQIGIIVIDSVAALVPKAEIEGAMGDSHVGLQARLMSQALRKLTGALSETRTTAVFINQLREKVGVFFGSPETTTGGKALKFYASVRLDVRVIETLKDGASSVGRRVRVKVVKNKCAPPFRSAELDLMFATGFSREGELVDMGLAASLVRKSGAWYAIPAGEAGQAQDLLIGQGRENSRRFLAENPAVSDQLELAIRARLLDPSAVLLPPGKPAGKLVSSGGPAPWEEEQAGG